jgi:hypothetical protein
MESQLIETPKAGEVRQYKMLIGGEWLAARSGKTFEPKLPESQSYDYGCAGDCDA